MNTKKYALIITLMTSYSTLFSSNPSHIYTYKNKMFFCKLCTHTAGSRQGITQHFKRKHSALTAALKNQPSIPQVKESNIPPLQDHISYEERVAIVKKTAPTHELFTSTMLEAVFNRYPNMHLIVHSEDAK